MNVYPRLRYLPRVSVFDRFYLKTGIFSFINEIEENDLKRFEKRTG